MTSDVQFLQNLFKKFYPAAIINRGPNKKNRKQPLFEGWLKVTPEESARLARQADHQDGPFIFLTGKTTQYIAVDLDRKNPSIEKHANQIDGVSYWKDNYDESDHMNTLIIQTPSGGYHLVYKYKEGIESKKLRNDILIDILSDGTGMTFGPGYEILNRTRPTSPPRKLVQQIVFNNVNYGSQQIINYDKKPKQGKIKDYSLYINAAADCDLKWDVIESPDKNVFTIIPDTRLCTVDDSYVHSEHKHSRYVVTKTRVVAKCFSHSERTITGDVSKRLREIFFPCNSFENFMQGVLELCSGESFSRLDGFVWKARSDRSWIYDRLASYEEFINTHFKGSNVFVKNPRKFADVIKYMETVDHESFPFIRKNADNIGFDNCVVDIVTYDIFDNSSWDNIVAPRHNIDGTFDWHNTETTMFDSLVQYQLGDGDVYMYFLAFIGRLFYKIKRFDNYNIVPLIKGLSSTGKSTVLTIIQKMFAPGAVGVLNSNNEITFGLESKYNKELIIAHEIGDKLTDRLSSDLFKQMVCGENISIPRKNKSAIDVTWEVPMIFCSNVHLSYADSQGSISRRLAIFKFDRHVAQKDITLETRIIQHELPAIIAKCLLAYKSVVEYVGSRSFWDACPEYFHENIREMSEQTDYVYMFLTLPPGGNVYRDNDVYFMKREGASMLLQDFKNKFMNYMRFRHPGVKYKWTSDYSSFEKLGYKVVYQNICKGCGLRAESQCCSEYNVANRSRRYVIENLACIKSNIYDD